MYNIDVLELNTDIADELLVDELCANVRKLISDKFLFDIGTKTFFN
jgi:hypothetical protein